MKQSLYQRKWNNSKYGNQLKRKWVIDNPKKRKKALDKYYITHKKEINERNNDNYKKNKTRYLDRMSRRNLSLKLALFELLGGLKCRRCGFTDHRALNIDHIHNDGNKDKPKFVALRRYKYYLLHTKEAKQKLQVLCANCNWIKEFNRREKERLKSL